MWGSSPALSSCRSPAWLVHGRVHDVSPPHVPTPQGQEKLSCNPKKENGTYMVLCELGNPMKAGARVRGWGVPAVPVTHWGWSPTCPSLLSPGHCGHGAERVWAGGHGGGHHLPSPAAEVTPCCATVPHPLLGHQHLRLSVLSMSPNSVSIPRLTVSPQQEQPQPQQCVRDGDSARGGEGRDAAARVRVWGTWG